MLKGFEEAELLGGAQHGVYAYIEALLYRDVSDPMLHWVAMLTAIGWWRYQI
jgi:hypothetical protein